MTRNNNKGFTLVELLVVIAIIAVLAGAIMIAINPAAIMMRGRDTNRLQDMDTLTKALNLALAEGEIALATTTDPGDSSVGTRSLAGSGWVSFTIPTGKTGLSRYLPTLPIDPTNSGAYIYTFASTTSNFEINCAFESADNTPRMTTDGGNSTTKYEVGTSLTVM